MLLEAHRWTATEAVRDGVVDFAAEPDAMLDVAMGVAREWAPKARMGVYAMMRAELWGEAGEAFQRISYVHGRRTGRLAVVKL
jgi:enoyl-CoA hydratase/carnithine racemase